MLFRSSLAQMVKEAMQFTRTADGVYDSHWMEFRILRPVNAVKENDSKLWELWRYTDVKDTSHPIADDVILTRMTAGRLAGAFLTKQECEDYGKELLRKKYKK